MLPDLIDPASNAAESHWAQSLAQFPVEAVLTQAHANALSESQNQIGFSKGFQHDKNRLVTNYLIIF